jgi:hypothetical protein
MSKKLNEADMQSELASSAFFNPVAKAPPAAHSLPVETAADPTSSKPSSQQPGPATSPPLRAGTVTPRHHETTTPGGQDEVIERIRRAVRQPGKEDATYRFTDVEKKALADIVYTYSVGGVRTSQNEITRVAINSLLEDYRANGAGSVLAQVLERLNE